MSILKPILSRRFHSGLLTSFNRRSRVKPRHVNGPIRKEQRGIDKAQGNMGIGSNMRTKLLNKRRNK